MQVPSFGRLFGESGPRLPFDGLGKLGKLPIRQPCKKIAEQFAVLCVDLEQKKHKLKLFCFRDPGKRIVRIDPLFSYTSTGADYDPFTTAKI